ncbi:MAG: hypothetical protein RSB23_05115 [Alistipes sp.]
MLGFSPIKKHANEFNYTPRYYDPAKEAREQRRAELHGERSDDAAEYKPGQYIRTQSMARTLRRERKEGKSKNKLLYMVGAGVILIVFIYVLYPRLLTAFQRATTTPAKVEMVEEFDPSVPIRVVPNDYQGE